MIERNYSIDILKFICAILVVFLHTDCVYHDYILPLTRCAVPCFFMISGYLLFNDGDIEISRLKRSTRNILHIIVWSTLLFACYKEAVAIHQGSVYIPSLRELFNFIVLNENPFGGHLWYLGAYLYVLLIAMIISKYKIWKYMFYAIPILLLTDLILGSIVYFFSIESFQLSMYGTFCLSVYHILHWGHV